MALTPTEEAQTRELIAQQAALLSLAGNETVITSKLGAQKVNLSQLPAAGALSDTDIFLVRQGTTDSGVAGSAFKSYTAPSAATESAAGIAEVATQTEADEGTDDARIVTPKKLRFGVSMSLDPNGGYLALPSWLGGVIIQWGAISVAANAPNATASFPVEYPNNAFQTIVCRASGSVTSADVVGVANSVDVFSIYPVATYASARAFRFISIGY